MCWNASVSLNTFLFSAFTVALALGNGVIDVPHTLFLLSFMSMQLLECLIWTFPSPTANRRLSIAGLLLICAQVVFSLLCIEGRPGWVTAALIAAYIAFMVGLLTLVKPWSTVDFRSVRAANGHLAWKWLNFPLWVIGVWLAFFLIRYVLNREWVQLGVVVAVVLFSYVCFYRTETWGSMWCWFSNAFAFYLLYEVFRSSAGASASFPCAAR